MIKLQKEPEQVLLHVDQVIALADSQKDSFGFLPHSAYREQAEKGQLWLAMDGTKSVVAGYILYGGTFPYLKVFQIYVSPSFLRQGVGRLLFSELKTFAIEHNFLYISAKVATELAANQFWQRMGLRVCDQIPAAGKKRAKNVYVLELATGSLFTTPQAQISDFKYQNNTQLRNLRYVLDLNVYFDVVKRREYADEALRVFRLGMTGRLKLAITEEFVNELKRNVRNGEPDPVLELAQAIPQWPDIPVVAKNTLIANLRSDIFPDRSLNRKNSAQDRSDLTHLALCIHYGADGFITREKAILRKAALLRSKYGLDVISPVDVLEADLIDEANYEDVTISLDSAPLSISGLSEADRSEVIGFLENLGLERTIALDALSPTDQCSNRLCWVAKTNDRVRGLLSCVQTNIDSSLVAMMYVDETVRDSERIVDHFFQAIESSQVSRRLAYIDLRMSPRQQMTYETAFARGYRKLDIGAQISSFQLGKWSYRGPILRKEWPDFCNAFSSCTQIELPKTLPPFPELQNTGLFVCNRPSQTRFAISLRDFETLTTSFLVSDGRPAVLIPIRYGYAKQLLGVTRPQRELGFAMPEALLRSERAYFCRPTGPKTFRAGTIVIFYVSGGQGGNKAVVGIARVTSAQKLSTEIAVNSLGRQGVLDIGDLNRVSNKGNEVMAITFDNYFHFPQEVPWRTLKKLGCIGGANLVTSQEISSAQLESILEVAYGEH